MFINHLAEFRDVAGSRVELGIYGEGSPVLFLHAGHGVDAKDPLVEQLAKTHKVYVPAHPGFGRSDLPEGVSTIDDIAYRYLDLIEALDLRDLTVVGVSLGAWIAVELATKGTGRIAKLVLIDAVGVKLSDRETRQFADIYATTVEDIPSLFFKNEEKGRAAFGNFDFQNMEQEAVTRFARNREAMVLVGWSPTLYNPKLASRLHRVRQPALLLWGADDRVASVDYGRQLADALPDARFEVIENAGHYGYLERPEAFAEKIEAFLA